MRANFLGYRAANADRNADDNEVGAFDRLGIGLHHLIRDAKLDDALSRLRRTRGGHDRTHCALRAGGPGNGGADQSEADDGDGVEQRLGHRADVPLAPRKEERAVEHRAVLLLGADGHAQRVGKAVFRDPPQDDPPLMQKRVGGGSGFAVPLTEMQQEEVRSARRHAKAEA